MPKICVVVRKAYGAGLYAMAGPGFEPDATIALPTAKIAVMGAEAAVNAVYFNKLASDRRPRRPGGGDTLAAQRPTTRDIDVLRLASELVADDVVEPGELRAELVKRFAAAAGKERQFSAPPPRRHPGLSACRGAHSVRCGRQVHSRCCRARWN